MYDFTLTGKFLSHQERQVFTDYLNVKGLEANIWNVFELLFESASPENTTLILRAFENQNLVGAALIVQCSKYGRALFSNKLLAGLINTFTVPFYQWIRFGCCMDMMSNPGFVKDPGKESELIELMSRFLQRSGLLTIINDYTINKDLYKGFSVLPALPHALIDCSDMSSPEEYIRTHKSIRKKINRLRKTGGVIEIIKNKLNESDLQSLEKCFIATSEKSIFYLPYQDLYLKAAKKTSATELPDVVYFVVRIDGAFVGYQAALKTGENLNALHGAFDRTRRTNYHAYDILFVEMTKFAIENNLKSIDFGAVLNTTKQRMVNKVVDMSYFISGKYKPLVKLVTLLLKISKIQGKQQMKYRTQTTN